MANTASQKLAQQIWAIANKLRGNMDASKFKDYILGVIFYRYLSAHTESYMDDLLKNDGVTYREALADPDLAEEVKKWAIDTLGYFIEPDDLFDSLVAKIRTNSFSVEDFERAIKRLTESTLGQPSEIAFANLFDAMDLHDADLGKEVSDRSKAMSEIIAKINDTPFAKDSEAGDVLGTAYMILIGLFQSGAGKKGGEFFTPTCASTLLAQLTTIGLNEVNNVSDGCAGSGSLLLEVARHLPSHKVHHYYAQEKTGTTYNLLRMNLIMHGVDYKKFSVFNADTLTTDNFYENGEAVKFDIQVENPPYSAENTAASDSFLEDPRYRSAGVLAPKGKADLAFVESVVYHMSDDGRAAILLPHGVLFRGATELAIRKYLIEKLNVIDAVIGLAPNMFHGTGIPVCILYLKKKRNGNSGNILFVDASKYYEKVGKNNALRASDIKRIVDCVRDRTDVPKFSRKVSLEEIRENDYNLNIPRYVESSEDTDSWDVYSLLNGGVPVNEVEKFNPYFEVFTGLKDDLFTKNGVAYSVNGDVKEIFKKNVAVSTYTKDYRNTISGMREFLHDTLITNMDTVQTQETESVLTDELFNRISNTPLIDRYTAYQFLYDEWLQIAADIETIHADGFDAVNGVEENMVVKKIKDEEKEVPDGTYRGKILPFELIQKELLADDLAALDGIKAELSEKEAMLDELVDSLSDDDKDYEVSDLTLYDKDKGALNTKTVTVAMKEFKKKYGKKLGFDEDSVESKIVKISEQLEVIKVAKTKVNAADAALTDKTIETIKGLDHDTAVAMLEKKWIDPFIDNISGLADAIVKNYINAVDAMIKKYGTTYAEEDAEIRALEKELASMLGGIKGNEADNLGNDEWIKFLGGTL